MANDSILFCYVFHLWQDYLLKIKFKYIFLKVHSKVDIQIHQKSCKLGLKFKVKLQRLKSRIL